MHNCRGKVNVYKYCLPRWRFRWIPVKGDYLPPGFQHFAPYLGFPGTHTSSVLAFALYVSPYTAHSMRQWGKFYMSLDLAVWIHGIMWCQFPSRSSEEIVLSHNLTGCRGVMCFRGWCQFPTKFSHKIVMVHHFLVLFFVAPVFSPKKLQ